jgi:hypothetical protein
MGWKPVGVLRIISEAYNLKVLDRGSALNGVTQAQQIQLSP